MGVSSLGGPFCLPFCNAVGHQRRPAHRVSQRELENPMAVYLPQRWFPCSLFFRVFN